MKYALLSVSNKSGIVDFATGLVRAGYTLISSGLNNRLPPKLRMGLL